MRYEVIGDTMPAVEITFDQAGECMYTQSGGMAWMSEGVSMDSNMKGGFGRSIGRMFSGESLFMATYKADRPGASIAFASTVAGEVLPIDVGACGGLIAQKGAFLCSENTVDNPQRCPDQEAFHRLFRRGRLYPAGYSRTWNGFPGN